MQAHDQFLENFHTLIGKLRVILKTKATVSRFLFCLYHCCSFWCVRSKRTDANICAQTWFSLKVEIKIF